MGYGTVDEVIDPAAGVVGAVLGTLIAGFFTWIVQKDKGSRSSWKDISDSERAFRQDLLVQIAQMKVALSNMEQRLKISEEKLKVCEKDHARGQRDIAELRRTIEQDKCKGSP